MPRIEVEDVYVDFPFQPYPVQVTYMEKVVAALKDRTNALLESPTGTGKTLSLLCSTLAWQQTYSPERDRASSCCGNGGTGISNGSMTLMYETDAGTPRSFPPTNGAGINNHVKGVQGKPVIVYASRTHSQLRQVIRELKATGYRPHTVILGSREQLCVHPEVSKLKGGLQNRRCGVLTQSRACRYKNNLDSYQAEHVGGGSPGVMDIEELKSLGQTKLVREEKRKGGLRRRCVANPKYAVFSFDRLLSPPDSLLRTGVPLLPDAAKHAPRRLSAHAVQLPARRRLSATLSSALDKFRGHIRRSP